MEQVLCLTIQTPTELVVVAKVSPYKKK